MRENMSDEERDVAQVLNDLQSEKTTEPHPIIRGRVVRLAKWYIRLAYELRAEEDSLRADVLVETLELVLARLVKEVERLEIK